eukprot:5028736-Pyramimonas_sp.AAC.1
MFGLESPTSPPEITQKTVICSPSSFILDNFAKSEFSQLHADVCEFVGKDGQSFNDCYSISARLADAL